MVPLGSKFENASLEVVGVQFHAALNYDIFHQNESNLCHCFNDNSNTPIQRNMAREIAVNSPMVWPRIILSIYPLEVSFTFVKNRSK